MKTKLEKDKGFVTGPRMYGCHDSLSKEKSPPTDEKGTTKDGYVDTASVKRPTFSEFVAAIERRSESS